VPPLNQTPSQHTRKFATKAGNWNRFQHKAYFHSRKWEELINKAATKEQLDEAITAMGRPGGSKQSMFPTLLAEIKIRPVVEY
jgi:hypothetical protein